MAKAKGKKDSSGFWKPNKIGMKLDGLFNGFFTTKFGLNMKVGEGAVSMNYANLKSTFGSVAGSLKQGKDKISIVLIDLVKTKRKNPTKVFEVKLNGKLLEDKFSNKTVDKAEIEKYFKS